SQMYTPGPAMSFLTCFCDLPQKEHLSRSPLSPTRATCAVLSAAGADRSGRPPRRYPTGSSCPPIGHRPTAARRAVPLSAQRPAAGDDEGPRITGALRCTVAGNRATRRASVLERGLARDEHLVDEAVLLGLLGGQVLVALDVLADLLDALVRVPGPRLLQPGAHAQHLVGLDLEIAGLAVVTTGERRLVDEHAAVGQTEALARR